MPPSVGPQEPTLEVSGLRVTTSQGDILRGVDLSVASGEVVGVVGESGCGKTTLGLSILGLLGKTREIAAGEIRLGGRVIAAPDVDDTSAARGSRIAYVPQDPFRAFDPLRRMGPQVRRPLELHQGLDTAAADARIIDLLARLGVPEPEATMRQYPHQLSGGMLQRAAVATALSCGPELVIADEPTTALDALVRLQVIESFISLVRDLGTSVIVITHDLRLLEHMADRIAAMYAGRIVEVDSTGAMLNRPRHPYPAALLSASVAGASPGTQLNVIDGQPPALPGSFLPCAYAPRCRRADERCRTEDPRLHGDRAAAVACHHPIEIDQP